MRVYTEGLNRHSFAVVNALPNITESSRSDGMLSHLEDVSGYDVGVREQTRSTTELKKLLEYLHVTFRGCKSLCRTIILRNAFTE